MRIFVDDGSTNIKLAWMEEGAVKTLISPEQLQARMVHDIADRFIGAGFRQL